MNEYFFDTFALVEINRGNPSYLKYKTSKFVTTLLNLMEFYNVLLREFDLVRSSSEFDFYLGGCVEITPEVIKEAVEFRIRINRNSKFRISYVDAIGYVISQALGIKFLTGDEAFRNIENVEFVK
ncbi:type II toxin-antitoxin system VapC family toxin [Candidatus Woesearchaeota archaeon]|nr:type II toxin-antitoxin system VapC family toxin [Candidatus Woesearchaeota archaeon]